MNHFSELRFRHFVFLKIYKPYIHYTQFALVVYAAFAIFDYQTLGHDSLNIVITRFLFVIVAATSLHVSVKRESKYLEAIEMVFFIFAGWLVNLVGYIAIDLGNNNYQSGVMLIMLYLGTLSRMRFSLSLTSMVTILIPYLIFLYPRLLDMDYNKESDHISIVITTMIICALASFRREKEVQSRYQQERQVRRQSLALTRSSRKLKQLSETDALTGLNNRHYLRYTVLPKVREFSQLGVIIADIDHFKSINDKFGHDVGDDVIQKLGSLIRQALPEGATAIRYGGEEFLIVLPNTDKASVELFSHYLKQQCEKQRFEHGSSVTLSIGFWHGKPFDSQLKYAIAKADMALYNAKESGRNTVMSA